MTSGMRHVLTWVAPSIGYNRDPSQSHWNAQELPHGGSTWQESNICIGFPEEFTKAARTGITYKEQARECTVMLADFLPLGRYEQDNQKQQAFGQGFVKL
ncbi:hypothetical protein AA106555_0504 [Neokomagataea thailandica NBRC 106555]|uniref:Uncharacterized protein n=1 Tax=Neokomagataea thailandica NBRC 106555 TaxID=1223520 RepID=A0ABQ0QNA9_9PROT|nr:hypothetical protein AA106555_0504 [Neokomagataea thailandica NBRC 106555]